jgi:hypothetical protein
MAISKCLFSLTYKNILGFSVCCVLAKLIANTEGDCIDAESFTADGSEILKGCSVITRKFS